jgi:hypothetical protein
VHQHVGDGVGRAELDRVDEVDARLVVERRHLELGACRGSPRDREHVEPDREHELEQQAGEEHGRRVAEDGEDAEHGVRPLVAEVRGDHAERDSDDERHDEGVDGELERCDAVRDEQLGDGLAVGDRHAEVAGEDLPEVLEVLHDDRAVVAGRVDALLQLGGVEPAAESGGDRVSDRAHQQEHHRHEDEHGGEDEQEPHGDVTPQVAAGKGEALLGSRRRTRSRVCRLDGGAHGLPHVA